jgi:predicted tellurium resistance membrane protein TerC
MVLEVIISLVFLIAMEVALGIDNVIFVSILAGKLPQEEQRKARRYWMVLGIALRVLLLSLITILIQLLKQPLFSLDLGFINYHHAVTGKHLILFVGGLFLLIKAVLEIHEKLETGGHESDASGTKVRANFRSILIQIVVIDLVFSIDSIVTAIGMIDPENANGIYVMSAAVIIAMVGMFAFARPIGEFVFKHPTFKMLALSFLLLIGIMLVAEGLGQHVSKAYIYFAMIFSILVEMINMRVRLKSEAIKLNLPDHTQVE